jgi:hypothetical protein
MLERIRLMVVRKRGPKKGLGPRTVAAAGSAARDTDSAENQIESPAELHDPMVVAV